MSATPREPAEPSVSNAAGSPPQEPAPGENESGEIPGERGIPSVNRVRSVQSRVTSVLAVTLMSVLAAALMIWYYSGAINRNARAHAIAEAASKRRAQGESTLPSLGLIRPPRRRLRRRRKVRRWIPCRRTAAAPVSAPEIPMATDNPYARPVPRARCQRPPRKWRAIDGSRGRCLPHRPPIEPRLPRRRWSQSPALPILRLGFLGTPRSPRVGRPMIRWLRS